MIMANQKEPSVYNLLKGLLIFTNEPLWFRIVMYLITAAFFVALIWALHQWAIPAFLVKKMVSLRWLRG